MLKINSVIFKKEKDSDIEDGVLIRICNEEYKFSKEFIIDTKDNILNDVFIYWHTYSLSREYEQF